MQANGDEPRGHSWTTVSPACSPAPAGPTARPRTVEVRAFFPKGGSIVEDPVTGSLNASLAEWLLRTGRADGAVHGADRAPR